MMVGDGDGDGDGDGFCFSCLPFVGRVVSCCRFVFSRWRVSFFCIALDAVLDSIRPAASTLSLACNIQSPQNYSRIL